MHTRTGIDRVAAQVLALALVLLPIAGIANPISPNPVAGIVSFTPAGSVLTITNTPGAIIDWGGFSVAASEVTQFVQQSATSAVLNRVTGSNPSVLAGTVRTNGDLHLVNTAGIAITTGSALQIGGGSLSSLPLSNADFLSGSLSFPDTPGAGNLVNEGSIEVAAGGDLVLAAPEIVNTGSIVAATGGSITVHGNLVNDGVIQADGGTITVFAKSLMASGIFIADTIFITDLSSAGPIVGPVLAVLGNASIIDIALGGLIQGADYDPFAAGSLVLHGGTLALSTSNGFVPQIGNTFQILDIQALAGSFGQISITGAVATGGVWDTSHIYVDGTVRVVAAAVPEPGAWTLMLLAGFCVVAALLAQGRRRTAWSTAAAY